MKVIHSMPSSPSVLLIFRFGRMSPEASLVSRSVAHVDASARFESGLLSLVLLRYFSRSRKVANSVR